ncbi:hypothetical protein [Delftia sp. ASV31]|uniref:hypothetical protein n=1 Tax=Delftia sp. ASV31 TaxID=2795113 RepID=UPI0018EA6A53|nr:hypothetical protein [Delftia sp. ASV31]
MRSNALYSPNIELPRDAWTTRALLYWDRLSSIVPLDHMHRPDQMSEHMRRLLGEGLVEPLSPGPFVRDIPRFDDCFIDLVEHRHLKKHPSAKRDTPPAQIVLIHAEKLGRIPDFLVEVGLARQVHWAWYEVEEAVANQFMSYLAMCLGAIPEVNAAPVTDKMVFASLLRPRARQMAGQVLHKHKAREVVLRSLLPTPAEPVDIDQLLLFKQRHGHLLPPLRAKVEAHCTRVAVLPDPEDRIEANEAFLQDCQQQITEIEAVMRTSFGKIVLGALTPLFGSGLSLHSTDPGNPVAYAGAALSLSGAAYQALASIHGSRAAVANRPLAYVAHARAALLPRPSSSPQ